MARNTQLRPNRRQLVPGQLARPPLVLLYAAPTINGPTTVFEMALNATLARVTNQAATPEVQRIKLYCSVGGVVSLLSAIEVGNEGESPSGTLLQITFNAVIDTDLPWILAIPTDSQLIQSRYGGFLDGSLQSWESDDDAPFGFIHLTNAQPGIGGFPVLIYVTLISGVGSATLAFQTNDTGASPFTLTGLPNIIGSSGQSATGISDDGGGQFSVTFDNTINVGQFITIPQWDPAIRGSSGQWLAPALFQF